MTALGAITDIQSVFVCTQSLLFFKKIGLACGSTLVRNHVLHGLRRSVFTILVPSDENGNNTNNKEECKVGLCGGKESEKCVK